MIYDNEMKTEFASKSENEIFARVCVAAFAAELDPTMSELTDIKTAVSEAVTNAVIHGYEGGEGTIYLRCGIKEDTIYIEIEDKGIGIENISEAMEPLYTSKPSEERSGMGFTVMESFMDNIEVFSKVGEGTTVKMKKKISKG